MTLIQDILLVAHEAEGRGDSVGDAADRILSAHVNGGLPAALLRQAAGRLESRMVHLLRSEVQAIVAGEGGG